MPSSTNPASTKDGLRSLQALAFFLALLSTAIALGGALAHLFELPNKISLPRERYFIVQGIYRGWAQLAYALVVEFVSILAVILLYRRRPRVFWFAVAALLCLVAAQLVFWTYTYPANAATDNWTVVAADWETLRRQWEYSHAVGAVLQLLAMSALIIAALRVRSN
jgi:hypothetical protein